MADDPHHMPTAARPGDPLDLATSVAGEEDPGASFDTAESSDQVGEPTGGATVATEPTREARMRPGDEAPPGTPGTGETVCPRCGGSGRLGASACPDCEGTGKVTKGIGGA